MITEQPDAALRTTGSVAGLDFGFSSALFATSEGQLLGRAMLIRLRELDAVLESVTADLQRRGIALKTDRTYRKLQARIGDYVANEIGRLLNRLAADDIGELVVERLDFRGGGLSKRMNRLCTRTGRRVLKARLARLTERHGIAVTVVPAPYSSQQCSGCDYVHKTIPQEPITLRVRVLRQETSRGRERVQDRRVEMFSTTTGRHWSTLAGEHPPTAQQRPPPTVEPADTRRGPRHDRCRWTQPKSCVT